MYDNWTETRAQMDQGLEAEQTMNRPRRQHQRRQRWQQVIGGYGRLQQALLAPLHRTPTTPLIVQPGGAYFLAAGTHRLRVLTGELWIPEVGIFGGGDRIDLRVDGQGVMLRPAAAHPAVFTLGSL